MAPGEGFPSARVLVVDDDADFRRMIRDFVQTSYEVCEAANVASALKSVELSSPDVVLLDLNLGNGHEEGLSLLAGIRKKDPSIQIVILSASRETDVIVRAMRLGASHYIEKAPRHDLLLERLRIAVEERGHSSEREARLRQSGNEMVGSSPGLARARDLARRAAENCDVPCLIRGETGTGKGLVAESIHRWSARRDAPWIHINIAALNPGLLESELFGHAKGSFTGALEDKKGFFELASRGTIFVDEIGDLQRDLQVKLLKIVDDGNFFPVGGRTSVKTHAHMIFATHEDLEAMVVEKTFREDLYHRLMGFVIEVPPLRARLEDLPELARRFLAPGMRIADGALNVLRAHTWPGNVRELRQVLKRASMIASDGAIEAKDIQFPPSRKRFDDDGEILKLPYHEAMERVTVSFQRKYIENLLGRCHGVVARASRESGIARGHLHTLINKLGLARLATETDRSDSNERD